MERLGLYLSFFVLLSQEWVQGTWISLSPDHAVVEYDESREVSITVNVSTVGAVPIQWILDAKSWNEDVAVVTQHQNLSLNLSDTGNLCDTFIIESGEQIGATNVTLTSTVIFNTSQVLQGMVNYPVGIVLNQTTRRTFSILGCIFYAFLLAIFFMVCTEVNFQEVKTMVSWIFGTFLIHRVLIPVVSIMWTTT
jgi:hypothetical protein